MGARIPFVIALAFFMTSAAASAAPLLSIAYTITGGSFSGPFSSGPVASGSMIFTLNAPVSAPYGFQLGRWTLSATGPSGSIQAQTNNFGVLLIGSNFQVNYGQYTSRFLSNGVSVANRIAGYVRVTANVNGGVGGLRMVGYDADSISTHFFNHNFNLGNEVRTFVPEPASGALVGLGLVVMGLVGGSGGLAARARRARRS